MNKERLLKLADHLEKGKLGHDEFNFKVLHYVPIDNHSITNKCGTQGCALGECPTIFPEWHFDDSLRSLGPVPSLIGMSPAILATANVTFMSACEFFNLTEAEADILFMPTEDLHYNANIEFDEREDDGEGTGIGHIYIGEVKFHAIKANATRQSVAQNIRKFVELKENVIIH